MAFSSSHYLPLILLPLLLSILTLTTAIPTPALVPRACTTITPINISRLNKTLPNDYINSPYDFTLSRAGGANSQLIKSVISFSNIPASATGCMLQVELPAFPTYYLRTPYASGTGTQSDVWLITNPTRADPNDNQFVYQYSWNKPPVKSQFVSTIRFPTEATQDRLKTYLWSGTCKGTLSFLFELSEWQQGGGYVNFFNSPYGMKIYAPIGFSMVHSC